MSASMTVYFVERTGHVVGAVTRAGRSPESQTGPLQEDLLVSILGGVSTTGGTSTFKLLHFPVAGKDLSTLVVPPLPAVLLRPLDFQAPKETDARPQEVKPLADLKIKVTLHTTTMEVNVDKEVAKDTRVWIMVTGGTLPGPLVLEPTIPKDKKSASSSIPTLAAKDHQLLVLVEGGLPFAMEGKPT